MRWGKPQPTVQELMLRDLLVQDPNQRQPTQMPVTGRLIGWLWTRAKEAARTHLLPRVPRSAWVILGGALALLVLAVDLHQSVPSRWPLGSLLMLGAPVVWWRGRSLARTMRVAASLVPIALGVWLALVWRSGPRPMLVLLLVSCALLAAGVYAWMRRGQETPDETPPNAANPEEVVARWETLTASKQLSILTPSKPRIVERKDTGWTALLPLTPGLIAEDVVPLAPRLASAIGGLHKSAVTVVPHEHADRVLVRVTTKDLLKEARSWPGPSSTDVTKPATLGVSEDGTPATVALVPKAGQGRSWLIAGQAGSGKSTVLHLLTAIIVACDNADLWGAIDPEATELTPWEAAMRPGHLVTDLREAGELLAAYLVEHEARKVLLRDRKARAWVPTPDEPERYLVIDELAVIAEESEYMESLVKIAQLGRKTGHHLILATQRPSSTALGEWGTSLRAQCQIKMCLHVDSATDVAIAFGPGAAAAGWRADYLLRQPGEYLVNDPEHPTPRRSRAFMFSDQDVQKWATKLAGKGR